MKLVLLRAKTKQTYANYEGQKVRNDDYYEDVTTSTDLYTVLCDHLRKYFDEVEIWYQEDSKHPVGKFAHSTGLVERFFTEGYYNISTDDEPDVLFVRGDMKDYYPVIEKFNKAFKIYYSAGNYYCPPMQFKWDLVFVDDPKHVQVVKAKVDAPVELFKKSCTHHFDGVSYEQLGGGHKIYDVCFICNAPQFKLKRLMLFREIMKRLPKFTGVVLGLKSKKLLKKFDDVSNVRFAGFIPRVEIGDLMASCRLGLVLSDENDGSPRVIQEFLASDLPIVVSKRTTCSKLYVNNWTGMHVDDKAIPGIIRLMLSKTHYGTYSPRTYFLNNLTMNKSAEWIVDCIQKYNGPIK